MHHFPVSQVKQNTLADLDSTCPSVHKVFFGGRKYLRSKPKTSDNVSPLGSRGEKNTDNLMMNSFD